MKPSQIFAGAIATVIAASTHDASAAEPRHRSEAVSCIPIRTAAQLQAMQNNLAASYCLVDDIDAGSIANFVPVGNGLAFTGNFFGNGHSIRNLRIRDATHTTVGLFGFFTGGTIRDVKLINAAVTGTAPTALVGALAGLASGSDITDVTASGKVTCGPDVSVCGGLIGELFGATIVNASSAVSVSGPSFVGGLIGFSFSPVQDSFSVGNVTCTVPNCSIGGLIGGTQGPVIRSVSLSGVIGDVTSHVGGLIGSSSSRVSQSAAFGNVTGDAGSIVGGLIGLANNANSITEQSYSVVRVNGPNATRGGLIGVVQNGATVTDSYWDKDVSAQPTSPAGTGLRTAQFRHAVPAGFNPAIWAITRNQSYPFVNDGVAGFTPQLATRPFLNTFTTFLPIDQFDTAEYRIAPHHPSGAALATVYTMIVRSLEGRRVPIDQFWDDAAQRTSFPPSLLQNVRFGPIVAVPATVRLGNANIIDKLDGGKLVILRGGFMQANGHIGTHWILGTLYTRNPDNSIGTIVANDPWTGQQVAIDPATKRVIVPSDFPLTGLKINAYRTVSLVPPVN
jgi:hypothetical protein